MVEPNTPDRRAAVRPETVSVQRAAIILTVHEDTVLRLIAAGKLIAFKVGRQWRIHQADINAYRRKNSSRPEQN